jgi:cytochrome c5
MYLFTLSRFTGHAKRLSIAACFGYWVSLTAQSADPPRPAADIYRDYCAVCHSGGWQGAPIANDAGEWKPRMAAGVDVLFKNAKNGLNAMPAMGTCMDCSDEELKSAIAEMLPATQ